MEQIPLLVVCGPTACGKTALSVALAKKLDGEVVSADSMLVYRGMDIGTAKPGPDETEGVPHHLMSFLEPGERFSVARYVRLAKEAVRSVHERGRLAILCGGTGLYIDSLTKNIQFPEIEEDFKLRESLRRQAEREGGSVILERLRGCDLELAEKFNPGDLGRIIRAIEVYEVTGVAMSEWQRRSRLTPPDYRLCMLGICYRDRNTLYESIDARVDRMLERGLIEEAKELLDCGISGTAAQAIGYKELFGYLRGEMPLEQAVERLKRETRRYAKRQLTWLRRDERLIWLYHEDYRDFHGLAGHAAEIASARLNGEKNGQNQ